MLLTSRFPPSLSASLSVATMPGTVTAFAKPAVQLIVVGFKCHNNNRYMEEKFCHDQATKTNVQIIIRHARAITE